jgi:hypothetical protein
VLEFLSLISCLSLGLINFWNDEHIMSVMKNWVFDLESSCENYSGVFSASKPNGYWFSNGY